VTDLTRLTAREMAARLRAGEVTARELAMAHLDAAERGNRALNAWLTIDREGALRQADAADERIRSGDEAAHPLLGIPVALKDLISVEGGQCTAGSRTAMARWSWKPATP
jgi:aspartyl-tRNA(Asn)/glutamyl-tRNA(Gln) amidotransferase subunit A